MPGAKGVPGPAGATTARPAGVNMAAERFSCSCKRFRSSASCASSSVVRRRASRSCSGISKRSAGMASLPLAGRAALLGPVGAALAIRPGEVFSSRSKVDRERCEERRASSSLSGRGERASSSLSIWPLRRSRSARSAARFSMRCPGSPCSSTGPRCGASSACRFACTDNSGRRSFGADFGLELGRASLSIRLGGVCGLDGRTVSCRVPRDSESCMASSLYSVRALGRPRSVFRAHRSVSLSAISGIPRTARCKSLRAGCEVVRPRWASNSSRLCARVPAHAGGVRGSCSTRGAATSGACGPTGSAGSRAISCSTLRGAMGSASNRATS
mmetsp:Transcript_39789/g.81385  ORF Transcript_39789/g.81385 Transcript_39789/m.81385 type:complete len:329 (+) Transcript_39789:295-1281(+)